MSKNLVIVESPAKAKTIEGYLGKDFVVKSSYGHVRDLPKGNNAIDIEKGFTPSYEISPDKKEVIKELKKLTKNAETVWLATDDDREGEAISWHLSEALNLEKKDTKRIVFHEITKKAIQNAIQSPRSIDIDLVNAQQARRVLDRLVGFELSPILWKKIKYGLSAGRVQSVTVRLVVEKERDIENFDITSFFRVNALFIIDGKKELKAELDTKFKSEEEAKEFLEGCKNQSFSIASLEKKPGTKKPAAPFTTSTLQQEASRKLGFSVSQTMTVAQRLYESGKITYMRTDSLNLSEDAKTAAKNEITSQYGDDFSNPKSYTTKSSSAQEAHEAIRPTDFSRHTVDGERGEVKLYELIWKRAIASQMSDAKTERTNVVIDISSNKRKFKASGEIITFEGFLKVYLESTDDEEDDSTQKGLLPPLTVGQALNIDNIQATQRFTRPPSRFTEASLVKQLEEMGIGRPSTYAPTISTIQKRGYAIKEPRDGKKREYTNLVFSNNDIKSEVLSEITGAEKNKLFPTDMGIIVTDFLVKNFPNVTNYSFTANIEEEFDKIAHGKTLWNQMIGDFYTSFHERVDTAEELDRREIDTSRTLGRDPDTGLTVLVRLAKFGPVAQIGTQEELGEEEKPKYASLLKGQMMGSITLEEALDLFQLPKDLGVYEDEEVSVAIGRFGPYVKFGATYVSLPKDENPMEVDMARAIVLIEEKKAADAPIAEYENLPVQKGVGRFGPFIKWNSIFINVNKKYDFDNLTFDDIVTLIEEKKQKEIDKVIHNWEEEGIRVEKARWGRFNILKGKIKIELPKTVDAPKLTLEEIQAIIEEKAPKKKAPAKKKAASKKKTTAKK